MGSRSSKTADNTSELPTRNRLSKIAASKSRLSVYGSQFDMVGNGASVAQFPGHNNTGDSVPVSHHQHNKFNRRLPSLPSSSRLAASSAAIWTSGRESEEMEIAIALSASLAQQHLNDLPPDERPLNGPTECIACLERLSPSSFPTQRIASACDHSPRDKRNSHICISCLATHLDVQLRESGPTRFTCPICNASLTHSELKQWASRQTFARIDLLQARNTLSSDPNFVWCSNPRCGAGQVHTTGSACPIVTCRSCKTRTCFNHQIQWHEGLTCHEFDHPEAADQRHRREKREEAAFTAYQQGLKKDLDRARRAEKKGKQAKAERILDEFIQGKGQQQQQQRDSARRAEKHRRQTEADRERAERALRRQEEKKGEAEVLRSSKPCPGRECGYRVYKIDGCKHMTCTRCRHEWCWICNKAWVKGHLSDECSPE